MMKRAGSGLEGEVQWMEMEALLEKYLFHDERGVEEVMKIA
jgi:hypothetical protein